VIRFATFEVDLRAGEVRKGRVKLKLTGQPFQVLTMLLEQPGEIVTREELQTRLWPETFVDVDHNLNTAINKVREVLGDSAENPRFVETLPRRGYRFIAPVEGETPARPAEKTDGEARIENDSERRLSEIGDMYPVRETPSVPVRTHRRWVGWSAVAALLVALAALSLNNFQERPSAPAPVQFELSPSGKPSQGDAFAVSPDGRHLAFAATDADGVPRLWIRDLDSLQVHVLSDSYPLSVNPPIRVIPSFSRITPGE
jgi:DNA-binding winged helix-turn-helix (wHTH) protein